MLLTYASFSHFYVTLAKKIEAFLKCADLFNRGCTTTTFRLKLLLPPLDYYYYYYHL